MNYPDLKIATKMEDISYDLSRAAGDLSNAISDAVREHDGLADRPSSEGPVNCPCGNHQLPGNANAEGDIAGWEFQLKESSMAMTDALNDLAKFDILLAKLIAARDELGIAIGRPAARPI